MIEQALEVRLGSLATRVGERLQAFGFMLATAESCTGGWVAKVVTDIAGSSAWFDRGFVTYSNAAKQDMLGVRAETLDTHGAVSAAVVREMVLGALQRSRSQLAVAISGIAGPGGGSADKPVGTVWMAWGRIGQEPVVRCLPIAGDREQVRARAVQAALEGVLELLQSHG
ncbi:nicotinamide-nucleotide amidase [Thiocystis violacea]|uniref:nicotinamide-nucleotide amidase n=1 Tax=Thiocystis violacea TaxID=13725 RepID=UPI00190670F9|nr:nicotinamide-nucleotide amidase [Thiocystis violacea]MBK1720767.1 damage-inducible protein CinA [Thiocystis violacea]